MAQSLADVGMNSAVDLFATYAGRASDLSEWLNDAAINRDRNLRMQYLAGFGLNLDDSAAIYAGMLAYRRFPEDLFTSAGRLESTRYGSPDSQIVNVAYVPCRCSGQPSRHASAYNADGSRSRISPLLPLKMIGKSSIVGGAAANSPAPLVSELRFRQAASNPRSHPRRRGSAAPAGSSLRRSSPDRESAMCSSPASLHAQPDPRSQKLVSRSAR